MRQLIGTNNSSSCIFQFFATAFVLIEILDIRCMAREFNRIVRYITMLELATITH